MMFKSLMCLLIILHILGDFYFQSNELAKRKNKGYRYVIIHSIIYALTFAVGIVPVWSFKILFAAFIISLMHFVIDSLKYIYNKSGEAVREHLVFCVDQLIHITVIFLAAFLIIQSDNVTLSSNKIMMNGGEVLGWICMVILLSRPVNITIKKLISKYKPSEVSSGKSAGAFIGTLERYIVLLMLSVSQYSAIGLILTAKSVARYDKISKDQEFAEYYLLGTLLSTLSVIAAYNLILK